MIEVCAKSPAPEFEIPKDKTFREYMLMKMGYQELEISETDKDGNVVRAYVVGRIAEEEEND